MKRRKTALRIAGAAVLLLSALVLPGLNGGLTVTRYTVTVPEAAQPVRIALITDLHSCAYGEGMGTLLSALEEADPDLILLGGDIFDDDLPNHNTAAFLRGLNRRRPCYYVTGNHEYWDSDEEFAENMAILAECGVVRLSGEAVTLEVNGLRLNLCGVDDPDAWMPEGQRGEDAAAAFSEQLSRAAAIADNGAYTILLTHRPEMPEVYCRYDFDLVLAGHAHGGQWRIPGILNGLYAPDQGFFPKYSGGRYELSGTSMIVSRGLARESTRLPRLYNPPELVIVELTGKS